MSVYIRPLWHSVRTPPAPAGNNLIYRAGAKRVKKDDLPNPDIFDEEFYIWKCRWLSVPIQNRPHSISETLKVCMPVSVPNIFTLLRLFATFHWASCERSASSLRRLNQYLRCTQSEERLSALALIHSNYDVEIKM